MNEKTIFFFETFYFYSQVLNNNWDFTYHEHSSYFTIKPLIKYFKNKDMQIKADYISQKQDSRKKIAINVNALIEESITNHSRAGIKIDNKSGWDSNEPIFKGSIGNVVLIDYKLIEHNH